MKGLLLFVGVVFMADGLFLIEYTRKEKRQLESNIHFGYISGDGFDNYYQKTEYRTSDNLDDGLLWINKKGAHSYHSFYGQQHVPPIDGFEFVALYKCDRIEMFQIQVGEETKIVQVPQKQTIPIMQWVTNTTILNKYK